jgi:hypothetical protein
MEKIMNCVLCNIEVEQGGYSTKVSGVMLRPLCQNCDNLCSSRPESVIKDHPWLFDSSIPNPSSTATKTDSLSTTAAPQTNKPNPYSSKIMTRYQSAYFVAGAVVGFGNIIKGVGAVLGIAIVIATLILTSDSRDGISALPFFIGAARGIFVGVIVYLLGVLAAALGEILKSTLDNAVNSSPFLTNDERAKTMSL